MIIEIKDISKQLGCFSLRHVSFTVQQGDYFVLLGASGVGKTVLLEILTGLLVPDSGSVYLDKKDITNAQVQNRPFSLVYQDQALFPHMTVYQNIAYGLRCRHTRKEIQQKQIQCIAEEVAVTDLLDRMPETLSGGEAQRVALARALVLNPSCLLLDEPLSSLDVGAKMMLRSLLRQINRTKNVTMIHVTHDYEEAVSLATRIGVMEEGTIVQIDTPERIFRYPQSRFVAQFIGIKNFFFGRLETADSAADSCKEFYSDSGITFSVLTDKESGPGHIVIRSEDVIVANHLHPSSARNAFQGVIIDMFPARYGMEIIVLIGKIQMAALVTNESIKTLGLNTATKVYITIKASAIRFIDQ